MTKTPKTARKPPCRVPLKGAYFPLIHSNEQATVVIVDISQKDGYFFQLECNSTSANKARDNNKVQPNNAWNINAPTISNNESILITAEITFRTYINKSENNHNFAVPNYLEASDESVYEGYADLIKDVRGFDKMIVS